MRLVRRFAKGSGGFDEVQDLAAHGGYATALILTWIIVRHQYAVTLVFGIPNGPKSIVVFVVFDVGR